MPFCTFSRAHHFRGNPPIASQQQRDEIGMVHHFGLIITDSSLFVVFAQYNTSSAPYIGWTTLSVCSYICLGLARTILYIYGV
jgi:hypothetical protein